MERLQHATKHEAFDWSGIAVLLGLAGMNVFDILEGIMGLVALGMGIAWSYWRIRATKAKAKAYENGEMVEDRRKL